MQIGEEGRPLITPSDYIVVCHFARSPFQIQCNSRAASNNVLHHSMNRTVKNQPLEKEKGQHTDRFRWIVAAVGVLVVGRRRSVCILQLPKNMLG